MRCLLFFPYFNQVERVLVRQASTKSDTTFQSGFTLLELLVVITLLAIVAGVATLGYEGVQDQGRADVTQYEMSEIRKALLQFRRDSGSHSFPTQGTYDCDNAINFPSYLDSLNSTDKKTWCEHPANFWMLFINPLDDPSTIDVEEGGWSADTKRGWNGPYLQRKNGYLSLDSNKVGLTDISTPIWGIASPYNANYNETGLAWSVKLNSDVLNEYGSPYLLLGIDTEDTDDDRIVSMGENHEYDGIDLDDPCKPMLDDYILCLLR